MDNLPSGIIYNGIQNGISYNLYLFTEKVTASTFGVRTTSENIIDEINEKIIEIKKSFEGK